MNFKLSQRERVFVALLYLAVLVLVYHLIGGDFDMLLGNKTSDNIVWFFSGALMIVMGAYIVEPYFTKPSDAIANSVSVLVALLGISDKSSFFAYDFIFWYAVSILALSVFCITSKDAVSVYLKKISRLVYWFVEIFGSSKFIFSIIYLSASYSYFAGGEITSFIIVITLWIVLTFFDIGGWLVSKISQLFRLLFKQDNQELGIAIGCENPLLYKVEINLLKRSKELDVKYGDLVAIETSQNVGSLGMVINKKHLINKRWLNIYVLQDDKGSPIAIDLKTKKIVNDSGSVFAKSNLAFKINLLSLSESEREVVLKNDLYKNRANFVGCVTAGSNINTINFLIVRESDFEERKISEGNILKVSIYGEKTLYQVINGNTKEEHLEGFDTHGYLIGVARKLGKYDSTTELLDISKWVPSIYSPIFLENSATLDATQKKEFAKSSIGRLPNTNFQIGLKDINAVVTHNTAILGILGIGKSCLTFELIKKVLDNTEAKVVCFDITGEYFDELKKYSCNPVQVDDGGMVEELKTEYETINKDIHKGGNHALFRLRMSEILKSFFENKTERLLVINPENYDVSRQTNDIKPKKVGPGPNDWKDQAPMADLTLVEKTRIISEAILEFAKDKGKTNKARHLLVFEEAHSLIPEWGSVSNEGDKSASNGIAKVVLQGRKYGLGTLIVTQRTANVSKSILNQCNTIFALRVFDDTGKEFLQNYIGKDYADTLPTLEERHAIAIGKGLRLKQPVIIQLNDKDDI